MATAGARHFAARFPPDRAVRRGHCRGQSRVFVIWQRVIRPDGVDVVLDSRRHRPVGRGGVDGEVNRHFFHHVWGGDASSIIGASAATIGAVGTRTTNNSISTYRSSVSQGFNDAARAGMMGTFVRIKPTINVEPGAAIKVLCRPRSLF